MSPGINGAYSQLPLAPHRFYAKLVLLPFVFSRPAQVALAPPSSAFSGCWLSIINCSRISPNIVPGQARCF
jgi:hypothetical protein